MATFSSAISSLVTAIATAINARNVPGASAYQLAAQGGYAGTQAQWLAAIPGAQRFASLSDMSAAVPTAPEGALFVLGRFSIDANSTARHRYSVWQVSGGTAIPVTRLQIEAGVGGAPAALVARAKLLSDLVAAQSGLALYGGVTELFDSDGNLLRWNGSVWVIQETGWLIGNYAMTGINGGYNASPGYGVFYNEYRYTGGKVRWRAAMFFNGGAAACSSQMTFTAPVAFASKTLFQAPANAKAYRNSTGVTYEILLFAGAGTTTLYTGVGGAGGNVSATTGTGPSTPFTWAQSDQLGFEIEYDPA